jgi:hypothetical protein
VQGKRGAEERVTSVSFCVILLDSRRRKEEEERVPVKRRRICIGN